MADAQDYTANGPTDIGFRTGGDGRGIANGVVATGTDIGVHGKSVGIEGRRGSPDNAGVFGESNKGYGVKGISRAGFPGVFGWAEFYNGVEGEGKTGVRGVGGTGVRGDGDLVGVQGESAGTGVIGISTAPFTAKFTTSGVFGLNKNGTGVFGDSEIGTGVDGHSDVGSGVHGASDRAYGGVFASNFAQIRLEPADSLGPPTTGPDEKGAFFVDASGALFYCYGGNNWVKLAGPTLFIRGRRGPISAVRNWLRAIFGP